MRYGRCDEHALACSRVLGPALALKSVVMSAESGKTVSFNVQMSA